jgi:hypothetical protein
VDLGSSEGSSSTMVDTMEHHVLNTGEDVLHTLGDSVTPGVDVCGSSIRGILEGLEPSGKICRGTKAESEGIIHER